MDSLNKALYEMNRRQLLEDIRLTPPDDVERYLKLSSALKELEEAHSKSMETENSLDPNKLVMGGIYFLGIVAVAVLDRHFPLTSKAFGMIAKPKIF